MKRGQGAIEFIASYAWAIILIIGVVAALYLLGVFEAQRYIPRSCAFQPNFPCDSFALQRNASTSPQLRFLLLSHNALGFDINITNATLAAENLGSAGVSNNSGSCVSLRDGSTLVSKGDYLLCTIPIAGSERIPRLGDSSRFSVEITYANCESAPNYAKTGDCSGGSVHRLIGSVTTQLEQAAPFSLLVPTPTPAPAPLCGNPSLCEEGDTCHDCAECEGEQADCPVGYNCIVGFCRPPPTPTPTYRCCFNTSAWECTPYYGTGCDPPNQVLNCTECPV